MVLYCFSHLVSLSLSYFSERIKKAEKRIQDQHKKYRVARRQAKQRDEEQRRQKEGTTYSAGAFNELTVTTAPAKKRKKNRNCDL